MHPDGVRPATQRASHAEGTAEMTRATGSLQMRWEAMGIGSGGLGKDADLFIVEEMRGHGVVLCRSVTLCVCFSV